MYGLERPELQDQFCWLCSALASSAHIDQWKFLLLEKAVHSPSVLMKFSTGYGSFIRIGLSV